MILNSKEMELNPIYFLDEESSVYKTVPYKDKRSKRQGAWQKFYRNQKLQPGENRRYIYLMYKDNLRDGIAIHVWDKISNVYHHKMNVKFGQQKGHGNTVYLEKCTGINLTNPVIL